MCDNISKYTQIINVKFDDIKIPIRLYNIKYLINDLLRMLFDTVPWLDIKYNKRIIRLAILMSLYHAQSQTATSEPLSEDQQVDDKIQEYNIGLFTIFSILHIISFCDYFVQEDHVFSKILIFKYIIKLNLNNTKLVLDKEFLNKIMNGEYGYDNIKYLMEEYLYKDKNNEFLCYILLLLIRKILIDSNEEWYQDIIKNSESAHSFPYTNFSEIQILLIKLLKTYIFHIINTTLILTNLKTVLIDHYGEIIHEDNMKLLQDLQDFRGGQFNLDNIGGLQKIDQNKQIEKQKEQIEKQIEELIEKQKNNLIKLYVINDYFEDVDHEYLLNSKMEPETIRKINDENKIEEVFNILKDILELK